jgi:hypothetical protein
VRLRGGRLAEMELIGCREWRVESLRFRIFVREIYDGLRGRGFKGVRRWLGST